MVTEPVRYGDGDDADGQEIVLFGEAGADDPLGGRGDGGLTEDVLDGDRLRARAAGAVGRTSAVGCSCVLGRGLADNPAIGRIDPSAGLSDIDIVKLDTALLLKARATVKGAADNDGYSGTAPDIGAQEAGTPPMQFGVNAYLERSESR